MRRIFLGAFFIAVTSSLWAQEVVIGLYNNPLVKPQPQKEHLRSALNAPSNSLELPFIDDFALPSPWPNSDLWDSKGVFVNNHYGIAPPTIGIATFDAQDSNGRIYETIGSISSGADTLSSYAINLESKSDVVLSFFYQPGGLGDMPEQNDLFKLEFYSAATNEWEPVWTASANERDFLITENYTLLGATKEYKDSISTKFHYVAIDIDEARFLLNGFRFRFLNLASMASSPVPGRESNCDHWSLDFVYLNQNRSVNDTSLLDVAICEPQASLALTYSSVPASHLNSSEAQRQLFGNPMAFTLTYQNLGWGTRNVTRRFSITPLRGSSSYPESYLGGSENIMNGQRFVRNYTFDPYNFTSDGDSTVFEITSYLITDTDNSPLRAALRNNDTTHYIQAFYNYYSYDDGTAENGYGLYGIGTGSGRVATKFVSYLTDSLRAISVYFNLARDSANTKAFRIAIWADNNGVPGTILYSQKVNSPTFKEGLNQFITYKLPQAIEIRRGQPFYIGWIQLSEVFLNIGYDINSTRSGVNFYSIGNTWSPSLYGGALMMRPLFGKASEIPDDAIPLSANVAPPGDNQVIIYPNPANSIVNLRVKTYEDELLILPSCRIDVYDISGRFVRTIKTSNGNFSVERWQNGIYFLRIFDNNQFKATCKILVSKN